MKKLNFNWSWGRKKDPPPESNKEPSKPKAAAISPGRVSVDEDNSLLSTLKGMTIMVDPSFRVEGIYEHKNDELFVLGIVDGIIQKLDSLFLIGPYGYEEKVEIQEWIEVDSKQNYYALLIDQCFQEEIDQGYIFTNKNNHLASSREEVYNPYLQFLLDQVNRQHYDYLDILFEQLATRAYFLAVFDYQDFPIYQINDKKYYPIYTSQLEMNKDQKCKNKKGSVYSFDDYSRMCLNQDKLDGIIINPYHKERSIVLNKDVIQHIRTIKEKNIKTYAKAKSYLKDRKRRQKYEIDYES